MKPITLAINLAAFRDPERKQRQSMAFGAIQDLCSKFSHLHPVNICFSDEQVTPDGWETEPTLQFRADRELKVTGAPLPSVRELFDRAAAVARRRGDPYFLFLNGDIILTDFLIEILNPLMDGDIEAIAVSRTDIDSPEAGNARPELYIIGQDVWVVQTEWWLKERERFYPYLLGVRGWDIVYTSQMLCHARACLLNTMGGLCYHVRHPQGCATETYNDYNFAAEHGRDRIYAQRYTHYQFMTQQFIQKHGRMMEPSENENMIRPIFIPPSPEELAFSESLAKAFESGSRHSYLRVTI